MGMYTTVVWNIKCERCKVPFDTGVQFKYGGDGCASFKNGEKQDLKFPVPYGRYVGTYGSLCRPCRDYVRHWCDWLSTRTKQVVLEAGVELRTTLGGGRGSMMFMKGKHIGMYENTNGDPSLEAPSMPKRRKKLSKAYLRIRGIVLAFWKEQIVAANLKGLVPIYEWYRESWFSSEKDEHTYDMYTGLRHSLVYNDDVMAVVGKTVRVQKATAKEMKEEHRTMYWKEREEIKF